MKSRSKEHTFLRGNGTVNVLFRKSKIAKAEVTPRFGAREGGDDFRLPCAAAVAKSSAFVFRLCSQKVLLFRAYAANKSCEHIPIKIPAESLRIPSFLCPRQYPV